MFEIDSQRLPFLQTRQALLVLDLQNDFLSPGGILPVQNPADLQDRIVKVLPHFRESGGNVIHVRSVFEASRPINESYGESESVITDKEVALAKVGPVGRRQSSRLLNQDRILELLASQDEDSAVENGSIGSADEQAVDETFLTLRSGAKQRLVLPESTGINFSDGIALGIDGHKDLIFQKTWYSAFKDGSLVQTLRSRFVTEIYICGALTNISVFATAMDATRHGYAITIVDDCLGYRSRARHDEALKQLETFTGCDIISSAELIEELKRKTKRNQKAPPPRQNQRPNRPTRPSQRSSPDSGLDGFMANLQLQTSAPRTQVNPTGPSTGNVALTESSGSVISESSNESPELQHLPRPSRTDDNGKAPDRVKSKIRSRRRPSNSKSIESKASKSSDKEPPPPDGSPLLSINTEKTPTLSSKDNLDLQQPTMPSSKPEIAKIATTAKPDTTTDDLTKGLEALELENSAGAAFKIESPVESELVPICAGDTTVINDLLHGKLAEGIFEKIRDEVMWQRMSHQGGDVPRLIAVQGEINSDGSIPIYRHPADESPPLLPFSPNVQLIRAQAEKKLGHRVNHVLIQFYRDGTDYISEHSDKTLDIVPNTYIANVSLGAQRTMVFRTKKPLKHKDTATSEVAQPRETCRAPLPHNSMCKMGLVTNERWLHGIRQDKRILSEKTAEELAYNGGRISLTFRNIGTFLSADQQKIWGQGAVSKTQEGANNVVNGNTAEAEKMIRAFGQENHSSDFDWKAHYGQGFDVLHISNTAKLFLSGNTIMDMRAKLMLAEYGIEWQEGKLSPSFNWKGGSEANDAPSIPELLEVKFVDNDLSKSTVTGDLAIILYLDAVHGSKTPKAPIDLARQFTRVQQVRLSLKKWREPFKAIIFRRELETWDAASKGAEYIAGSSISVVDFMLWPVLDCIKEDWVTQEGLESLKAYYERMKGRETWAKVLNEKEKTKEHV